MFQLVEVFSLICDNNIIEHNKAYTNESNYNNNLHKILKKHPLWPYALMNKKQLHFPHSSEFLFLLINILYIWLQKMKLKIGTYTL